MATGRKKEAKLLLFILLNLFQNSYNIKIYDQVRSFCKKSEFLQICFFFAVNFEAGLEDGIYAFRHTIGGKM